MSKNRQKRPKAIISPSINKEPRIASNPSYNHLSPSWRISKLEMVEPYGWHTLDSQKLNYIQQKLANFESMTWDEILIKAKHFHHSVNISQLSSDAKHRLSEIKQDDIDDLISLRLSAIERVWGILDQGVLTLLWWDSNHKVCPSLLKNT
jgi:hypothetical protein